MENPEYTPQRHWIITQEGLNGFFADLKILNALNPHHTPPCEYDDLRLARYDNGVWEVLDAEMDEEYYITWPGVDHFSLYTFLTPQAFEKTAAGRWMRYW